MAPEQVALKELKVQVAKEVDDIMVLMVKLIEVLRSGKDITGVLPQFIDAVNGIADVPKEAKEHLFGVVRSVANRSVDIAEALLTPKVVPV